MTRVQSQLDDMLKSNGRISNTQGIKMAYDRDNKVYVRGNKMYVGGTVSANDWKQNFTMQKKTGQIRNMDRYKEANPQVDTLLGHSMGGSVVLELNNEFKDKNFKTRTYDAPAVSLISPIFGFDRPTEQHKRFRKAGDLVSSLDNAAISYNTDSLNPIRNHDVDGLLNIDESYLKWVGFNLYYYNMMFNKPKHIKEPHRVGKPSESVRFKNKLVKNMNNSAYESIRNIIEEGDNVASQPQLEKQNNEHF